MPVPDRIAALSPIGCPTGEPWRIIRRFHRLSACRGLVAYALRTRAPLSRPPKEPFPFDLHVLGLPLAFILSQDQTLRCTIVLTQIFLLNLGFRLSSESRVPPQCSLGVPFKRFLPSRRSRGAGILCWPQTFKELSLTVPLSSSPLPFRKRVQKYYLFPNWQALFSNIFLLFFITLTISEKKVHHVFIFLGFRVVF